MRRRDMLFSATAAAVGTVVAANAAEPAGTHHHQTGESPLVDVALDCVKAGEICQAHCFDLFTEGDTSVAACARSVAVMKPVCTALAQMAAERSPLLPRYAAVCADVCRNCEEECRKHADKHAPCKACMEACAATVRECARVSA